jgi:CRISPR-associated protein Cas4
MVSELDVNRWLLKAAESLKILLKDEITVTEVASPCLRKSYYLRTRSSPPSPAEFLKMLGNEVHLKLAEVLESEGCDVEVSVGLQLGGFKLRGRVDALCPEKDGEVVIEFKSVNELPAEPYQSHLLQLQAYLLMLKLELGYLVYLSRASGRVKVFKVGRDGRALKQLVERARQYHKALAEQRPPPPERGPWCSGCPYTLSCR